jgi:hypothetical protein
VFCQGLLLLLIQKTHDPVRGDRLVRFAVFIHHRQAAVLLGDNDV